jgi:YD repeat-containing protein
MTPSSSHRTRLGNRATSRSRPGSPSQSGEGITNAYDGFGRMVSSSTNMGGATRTLTYQYDRNGNRTRITHPDGPWFDLTHDGLNRPSYLSVTSSFGLMFTSYTAHGLPNATSRGNDSLSPYDYDGVQRLNYLGHWFPNSAGNGLWTYARNPPARSQASPPTPTSIPGPATMR